MKPFSQFAESKWAKEHLQLSISLDIIIIVYNILRVTEQIDLKIVNCSILRKQYTASWIVGVC